MSFVDQKVFGTVIWSFDGQDCLVISNHLMVIVSPEFRFFDRMSCCLLVRLLGRSGAPVGLDLVEISEISRIYSPKSSSLTIKWFVYYLGYYFPENSTEAGSWWNFNPSTRFWSQNRVKWPKNTQQCPKRSKTDEIGQKIGLCGEQKTSTNLEFFFKNPKSTIGSPGLNIGRSESDEDSIFVSDTFHTHCECF